MSPHDEVTLRIIVNPETGAIDLRPFVERWAKLERAEARRHKARAIVAIAGGVLMTWGMVQWLVLR